MNIVLIAPDGTVAYFWNTDWTWPEVFNSMRRAAQNGVDMRGQALYGNLCARCHEVRTAQTTAKTPRLVLILTITKRRSRNR